MWDQFLSRLNSFDPGVLKSFFLTIAGCGFFSLFPLAFRKFP
nr:MAG TPA: hypothetical protein [Caudoviricetes sp.]